MTILWESREKGEWKSRVEKQSRAISLKARGEEERQCEPVGTWRKQVKRSLLLSTATRRGLARACLFPFPYALGIPCPIPLLPYPSGVRSLRRPALLSLPPQLQPSRVLHFSSAYQKRTKLRLVLSMFSHILPQLTDSNTV